MFKKSVFVIFVAMLVAFGALFAATAPGSVAVTATIPVADTSDDVSLSPNGSRAYVVTRTASGPGTVSKLVVIDTSSQGVVTTVNLGPGFAFEAEVSPDGSRVYVAISRTSGTNITPGANRVEVVDAATNSLIGTVLPPLNGSPTGTAISPDGSTLYVSDRGNATQRVSVIDTATLTTTGTITGVGPGPVDLEMSPDGTRLYAVNRGTPVGPVPASVAVIDTATDTVLTVITIPGPPSGSRTWAAISPDGGRLYVTTGVGNIVTVFDTATNTVSGVITTGLGNAVDLDLTPDGLRLFVVKSNNSVVMVDTDSGSVTYNQVIDTVSVPTTNGIDVSSSCGTIAYVSGGSVVSVLSSIDDADGDGVCGSADNCPVTANPLQEDFDVDGLGDACDIDDDGDGQSDTDELACGSDPLDASSTSIDTDADGVPNCVDTDDDGDGVVDGADNCPLTANTDQLDTDGDGAGNACDADDDGDGINDGADNCPLMGNTNQANNDGDAMGDVCDPDDDNDGIQDGPDNCDFTPNPDQRDTNGDGVGDLCTPFQTPAGGQFVVGDLANHAGGATVNFWGPQWRQNNPMTGGLGPSAFKGFENGGATPTCGSMWTSQPGNSSNPPPTVPPFMAVIVSSSVVKNGSVITGNVKKIIVVQTNAGYGPSPGQVGTGRVIAILCTSP